MENKDKTQTNDISTILPFNNTQSTQINTCGDKQKQEEDEKQSKSSESKFQLIGLQEIINLERKIFKSQKVVIDLTQTRYSVLQTIATDILTWTLSSGEKYCQDWNLFWHDTYINQDDLRQMLPFQKINHFPGSYNLGKKNYLGKNLSQMRQRFPQEYDFFPKTWLLPKQYEDLRSYQEKNSQNQIFYIVQPEASCQGRGIYMTQQIEGVISASDHVVVQQYISNPYLIENLKFDLRIYVLVQSVCPLQIFIYREGLARLATSQYTKPSKQNLNNMMMHLTNYAINKKSPDFIFNQQQSEDHLGHKRSFTSILQLFKDQGRDIDQLMNDIRLIVNKTLCSVQPYLSHLYKACQQQEENSEMCFEVFGFDVMIDQNLKPWLIQVNHTPSFHVDTPLDLNIKKSLLLDTLLLANVRNKQKLKYLEAQQNMPYLKGESRKTPQQEIEKLKFQIKKHEDQNMGGYLRAYPIEDDPINYQAFIEAAKNADDEFTGTYKVPKPEPQNQVDSYQPPLSFNPTNTRVLKPEQDFIQRPISGIVGKFSSNNNSNNTNSNNISGIQQRAGSSYGNQSSNSKTKTFSNYDSQNNINLVPQNQYIISNSNGIEKQDVQSFSIYDPKETGNFQNEKMNKSNLSFESVNGPSTELGTKQVQNNSDKFETFNQENHMGSLTNLESKNGAQYHHSQTVLVSQTSNTLNEKNSDNHLTGGRIDNIKRELQLVRSENSQIMETQFQPDGSSDDSQLLSSHPFQNNSINSYIVNSQNSGGNINHLSSSISVTQRPQSSLPPRTASAQVESRIQTQIHMGNNNYMSNNNINVNNYNITNSNNNNVNNNNINIGGSYNNNNIMNNNTNNNHMTAYTTNPSNSESTNVALISKRDVNFLQNAFQLNTNNFDFSGPFQGIVGQNINIVFQPRLGGTQTGSTQTGALNMDKNQNFNSNYLISSKTNNNAFAKFDGNKAMQIHQQAIKNWQFKQKNVTSVQFNQQSSNPGNYKDSLKRPFSSKNQLVNNLINEGKDIDVDVGQHLMNLNSQPLVKETIFNSNNSARQIMIPKGVKTTTGGNNAHNGNNIHSANTNIYLQVNNSDYSLQNSMNPLLPPSTQSQSINNNTNNHFTSNNYNLWQHDNKNTTNQLSTLLSNRSNSFNNLVQTTQEDTMNFSHNKNKSKYNGVYTTNFQKGNFSSQPQKLTTILSIQKNTYTNDEQ